MGRFFNALKMVVQAAPATPPAGSQAVYLKADGRLWTMNSAGVEYPINVLGQFSPWDHGLLFNAFPFELCNTGHAITSGTIYMIGMTPNQSATTATIFWVNNAAATSLTAGQCFAAILNSAGTVLGTVSITGNGAIGAQSIGLAVSVTAGQFYWVAFLWVGTTPPQMARAVGTVNAGAMNVNRTASEARYCTNGTGQTSITNRTPASNTNLAAAIWCAVA